MSFDRDGRISNLEQVCSLRRYRLEDGTSKGLEMIDCDNGNLRFVINVSKGLDVPYLYHQGQNLAFLSKNGLIGGDLPFEKRFEGGILYTAGLDSLGKREGFELHGSHHQTPGKILRAEVSKDGISVEGEVLHTALFSKNLRFKRRIFSPILGDYAEITDVIENLGYNDEDYCILYHVNLGYPFLDEGARVEADCESMIPRTDFAKERMENAFTIDPSSPLMEEVCYFLNLKEKSVSLINEKIKKTFTLSWKGEGLDRFVLWKSPASGDYALGLEPSTSDLDSRFKYSVLKSGETVSFSLKMTVKNNK